jgi:hypothetical protein
LTGPDDAVTAEPPAASDVSDCELDDERRLREGSGNGSASDCD